VIILKHLPNLLTLCNLLCGCLGILYVMDVDKAEFAPLMILLAAFFDLLDGAVARLLGVTSPIGKELDSLADMVSFGVLPGFILYSIALNYDLGNTALLVFVFVPAAALRLAKFNVDDRQGSVFLGLPTPAAAIFVAGLPYCLTIPDLGFLNNPFVIILIAMFLGGLMVSEIPLLSFKFSGESKNQNPFRIITVILSLTALGVLRMAALPFIVVFYLIISFIGISRSSVK